ncbi:arginine metabolism regulation protein II [Exophiala xenobiotica]|nr:arginine metabolism regulation protein II [Exophiala xenobiotica]KAK5475916.1 arginine metabolism regulation protein II [Exophiala xenobiotica]
MPPGKKRIREIKTKTKTFSGCWTCRGRKVKCDATRPQCTRCLKAGLQCEGYDLRLYWITDDDTVAPSAIKRQAMTLEGTPNHI